MALPQTHLTNPTMHLFQVPYSMHHLVTEMYTYVHIDVRKWLQNIWPMNRGIWDMGLLSAVISRPVFHLECFRTDLFIKI